MAYEYLSWTFIRNFIEDPVSRHLTKTPSSSGWDSRAYIENAWSSLVPNAGVKIFHNDNPGEVTKYAVGIAALSPNSVYQPNQLKYGLYFHDNVVEVVCDGTSIAFLAEKNAEYEIKFTASGTLSWSCDSTTLFDCTNVETFALPLHIFMLANIAYDTELEMQVNLDGVELLRILDVFYYGTVNDSSGIPVLTPISVYGNASVPTGTQDFHVVTQGTVDTTSINDVNFIARRLLRPGEDPQTLDPPLPQSATRVPFEWGIGPQGSGTDMLIHLYGTRTNENGAKVSVLSEGDTIELILGSVTDPWDEYIGTGTYDKKIAIFKYAGELPDDAADEELGEFFNDIYFKLRNLDTLIDIDKIIFEASNTFDFQYKVSEYDAVSSTYNKVYDPARDALGFDDTDRIMRVVNSQTIEDLFVKQYLPEYIKYMSDVNNPTLTLLDSAEVQNLKSILFKNITLMNYFKGNRTQMEFLVSIFSSCLGYYYVSVDPDPYYNFVYRVSTTLPERFWTDDIKDITHPLGWNDFYVEVPRDATAWHQLTFLADGTDAEAYFEQRMVVAGESFIDFAAYLDRTTGETFRYGTFAQNAMEGDLLNPAEFPFHPQEYLGNVDYGNAIFLTNGGVAYDTTAGLFHELVSHQPIWDSTTGEWSDVDSYFRMSKNGSVWKFEFTKTGIGAEYIWEVYRSGTKKVHKTYKPIFFYVSSGEDFNVKLRLKMKDWIFTPWTFNVNDREIATLKLDYRPHSVHSYLSTSVNDRWNRYDGACAGDFNTPYEFAIRDGDYDGVLSSADMTSIAALVTIDSTSNVHSAYFNDSTTTGHDFNHVSGVFTEYEWVIRNSTDNSGTVINRIRTSIPHLLYVPALPGSRNVEVILIRGDLSLVGPNKTI